MLSGWQKNHYLRIMALILLAFFMVAAAADAAVCQIKTDQNGNCLLPCLCCHIAGAIHASPIIHFENATSYVQVPVKAVIVLLASSFFHPPRA